MNKYVSPELRVITVDVTQLLSQSFPKIDKPIYEMEAKGTLFDMDDDYENIYRSRRINE